MDEPILRIRWTRSARRDLRVILDYVASCEWGDPVGRSAAIMQAVDALRDAPEGCRP